MTIKQVDLTAALRAWAFRNAVRPVDFMMKMGYTYAHSWNMISRVGKGRFTPEAWGRFILAYGVSSFEEVLRIARVNLEQEGEQ